MYKNQLQELAQRSCFNLPSYTSVREGPDHAPRFKATVNFNGEIFESPSFCGTLRQAEHSAAEVALNALANRGPSHSLAARILDETGVYKNLLQEVSQRVGASLPMYTTYRSGLGHLPVFSCTVELAGIRFTGEPAKNKKQAEKNAAMAAWSSLKLLAQQSRALSSEKVNSDEQEHVTVARALQNFLRMTKRSNFSFPIKFPTQSARPSSPQPPPIRASKLLPLIYPKTAQQNRSVLTSTKNISMFPNVDSQTHDKHISPRTALESHNNDIPIPSPESPKTQPHKFPVARAAPYIPVRHFRAHHGVAPPVNIRNAIPVFSAPLRRPPPSCIAPPVSIRQAVPVFAAPVSMGENAVSRAPPTQPGSSPLQIEQTEGPIQDKKSLVIQVQELKI